MQEYTFIFSNVFAQETEFDVVVDETVPLMEALLAVIEQSAGTQHEIPTARVGAPTGESIDILWTFGYFDPDGDIEELVGHLSLDEQGVPAGSDVIVGEASLC